MKGVTTKLFQLFCILSSKNANNCNLNYKIDSHQSCHFTVILIETYVSENHAFLSNLVVKLLAVLFEFS